MKSIKAWMSEYWALLFLGVLFIIFICMGVKPSHHTHEQLYHSPGVCKVCGTRLEKTVNSNAYHSNIVWYCPNPECPY